MLRARPSRVVTSSLSCARGLRPKFSLSRGTSARSQSSRYAGKQAGRLTADMQAGRQAGGRVDSDNDDDDDDEHRANVSLARVVRRTHVRAYLRTITVAHA